MRNGLFNDLICRAPYSYNCLQFPTILPPPVVSLPMDQLPIMGFLEQSLGSILVDAMNALANKRPKYPGLNSTTSVLIYVALYLKGKFLSCLQINFVANNPANSFYMTQQYKTRLDDFVQNCDLPSTILDWYRNNSLDYICATPWLTTLGTTFDNMLTMNIAEFNQ